MGIQGLLQFIKDASEPVHVKKYKGQTVAVDTYCWLHKGAFSCAEKLAKGEPTDQYVTYCMKLVDMLLSFGVKPVLVFDGCNLPSKQDVERARRERRQANLLKGKQLLREGKISEARDCFTRCVNVTPAMAHDVIKAARGRGVDCVVAPYEADAQLAFLNKCGIAQAIITEDSDLLAFGCKKVILKMDKLGNGLEIDQAHLGRCRSLGDIFTEEKFRYMCILSGCDYLASLYGIGLGKACRLLKMANNPDILKVIRKMGQYLKMNISVPDEYVEGFIKANNTFLYQLVFDPISRKVVPLNPYPDDVDPATLSYAGINVGDKKGLQMALGNVDIHTMEKIDNFEPGATRPAKYRSQGWNDTQEKRASPHVSIWTKGFVPGTIHITTSPSNPSERPVSTKGKERVISVKGLKLPPKDVKVKRPRPDSTVSEEDILLQYSVSAGKRHRPNDFSTEDQGSMETLDCPVTAALPRARNRFATLLQRRNQCEDEAVEQQGTISRFFNSRSTFTIAEAKKNPHEVHSYQGVVTETTEATVCEESCSPSERPTGQGLGVFSLDRPKPPALSGLSTLLQFQRKRETFPWTSGSRKSDDRPASPSDNEEEGGRSPPSQDSAYFSQPSMEEVPRSSFNLHVEVSSSELKSTPKRCKVAGLPRVQASDAGKGSKIRTSAPARASGLRKKPPAQGKKASSSDENKPVLQSTISGLWKNFGFKKENEKILPCKKGEPMSPVKDNVQSLSPC
uniref:Exonuclease 1 n=1 Tax=Denticeps clupeoides TaxID=299321 RepID=A0AAY4EYX5_9TELE